MLNTKMAPWPSYTKEEISAVAGVLGSNRVNYWTGQECREFECEFANWAGAKHAIALANGTVALDLALKGLGVGPGDEVIVTPRTFIASISSVVTAGATPIFADVDLDSGNISPATIRPVISEKTRAIIPVHLAGWPCEMEAVMAIADEFAIKVIEDCAQAHGAKINGASVGIFGHVGAWSFCLDKIMTTGGEGGLVTTNDPNLWSAMWSYKDHGKSWNAVYEREHNPGFRWLHETFGTNWRMLEMQAIIGRIQLRRMTEWTKRRTDIAMTIKSALDSYPGIIRAPLPDAHLEHAFYRLYAYIKPEGLKSGWSRDRIVAELNARDIPVFHGTCSEVYLEKAFEHSGFRPAQRLPNALLLGETSLMFLTHPTLSDNEIAQTCNGIRQVLDEAVKY